MIPQVSSSKVTQESPYSVVEAPLGSKLLLRNLRVLNLGSQRSGGKCENTAKLKQGKCGGSKVRASGCLS